jgi:DNA-binding Xre family transcriptional regulator
MSVDMLLVPDGTTHEWTEQGFPAASLRSDREVREAYERFGTRRRPVVWIADDVSPLVALAEDGELLKSNHRLLLLDEVTTVRKDLLHLLFRVVVAPGKGVHLLPTDELREVLASEVRADLFVAGVVDAAAEVVVLYRGNLEPVIVPLAWFIRRNPSPRPNFRDFRITDYGQSVRFGKYEASSDAILYAHDPDYRRRAKERRLRQDNSLGACIRRLRLAKGVARHDFPGVSDKQIARIERGEIATVRAKTLAAIAARLEVDPSEITSY